MQPSEIITVNIWQILVSLLNLLILFLIIKKFLYKPVKNILKTRTEKIDESYTKAQEYLLSAQESKAELEEELSHAHERADAIINEATVAAGRREEKIISDARGEAEIIIRQAKAEAILEKQKAQGEIKTQIVDVSFALGEKIIEREIKEEDHRKLIDSVISQIGEGNEE